MIAEDINVLGKYCGIRDISSLEKSILKEKFGLQQADVMVLFGGTILCGGDVLAEGISKGIAKQYVIVGGAGHTTQTLRDQIHRRYPNIITKEKTEAEILNEYIRLKYGFTADYLEEKSTNCGNNITFLLKLLEENRIPCNSIILSQDATMQRRMTATLRKYRKELLIINYATYQAEVIGNDDSLTYKEPIDGMWDLERYISLLMGEIPRLRDDADGYGPKGKGFLAHEEIPHDVSEAFERLKSKYKDLIRAANPKFAIAE